MRKISTKGKITMLSVSSMIFDARIQREAKALRDVGYQVTIMYIEDQQFFYSLPDPEQAWKDYNAHMEGIKSVRYFLFFRSLTWLPKIVTKPLQAIELFIKFLIGVLVNKADIYHCHDLTPALFTWIGKSVYSAKLVYDAHEMELEIGSTNSTVKKIKEYYERKTVKKSSLSITVNDYIANVMAERYKKDVKVIGNKPLYVGNNELDVNLLKTEADLPSDAKIVLYVGYLNLSRGIDKMAEALAFLPDNVYFLLMGTGRLDEYKKLLYGIIDDKKIDKRRLQFVGPFPPTEVVKNLSGADVSVMLYQADTSNSVINAPNKLFQSVMARVPVVGSNNKSFPVFLYENPCGTIGETVDETSPKDIARGIMKVLEPDNQKEYRKNADCYAEKISWEYEAEKLVKYYQEYV